MQSDPAAVDHLFKQLARQRLESRVDLAETRLAGTGIKCFVTGGNDDDPSVLEPLYREGTQSFFGCENKMIDIDDEHTMVSMGYSTPTPWKTPREVTDERLGEMIEEMIALVPDKGKCIFNFHDPPVDSTLDTCPELDWTTPTLADTQAWPGGSTRRRQQVRAPGDREIPAHARPTRSHPRIAMAVTRMVRIVQISCHTPSP